LQLQSEPLAHRTFNTLWNSSLWGEPADRSLAVALFGAAALGVIIMNEQRQRAAARMLAMGAGGLLVLALGGIAWPSLGRLGTSQLLVPGLWFAVPPAVYGGLQVVEWLCRLTGSAWRATLLTGCLLLAGGVVGRGDVGALARRCLGTTPLAIGLGPERQQVVDLLRSSTTPAARILWEDRAGSRIASRWAALLPVFTGRPMIGGLGPDVSIEHASVSLVDQNLAGRPIQEWSDDDLDTYCRRYNVGWLVAWEAKTIARFRNWRGTQELTTLRDGNAGVFFALKQRSFVLVGKADWLQADCHRIALANVIPQDGKVVLSLHYQVGFQVSPSRVQIEREPDPFAHDPIPFIRLQVPSPVSHLTITWSR
jgi:hypothetical protein